MEIYLTSQRTGARLRIPLLPDRLNVKTGASVVSLSIIKKGEVKIPRGSTLTGYSWNGVFPSDRLASASFVYDWQEPAKIIKLLEEWQENGDTVTLMVTDLSINVDTFIVSFVYEYYGMGDVSYTLNLSKRLQLYVTTAPAPASPSDTLPDKDGSSEGAAYGVVTCASLRVRKGPGIKQKAITTIPKGLQVEILDKSGCWYKVIYDAANGSAGWVHASYIRLTNSVATTKYGVKSNAGGKKQTSKDVSKSTKSNNTTADKSLVTEKPGSALVNVARNAVKRKVSRSRLDARIFYTKD